MESWAPSTQQPPTKLVDAAIADLASIMSDAPTDARGNRTLPIQELITSLEHRSHSKAAAEWAVKQATATGLLTLGSAERKKSQPKHRYIATTRPERVQEPIVTATELLWSAWSEAAKPDVSDSPPGEATSKDAYDVGIFIALKEELQTFREYLNPDDFTTLPLAGTTDHYYAFSKVVGSKRYRCVLGLGGQYGEQRAGRTVERMIDRYQPQMIVVLGIAGGLSFDVRLCDVVVATFVESYLEGAKVTGGTPSKGILASALKSITSMFVGPGEPVPGELHLAGEPYRTNALLKDAIENMEFANGSDFARWRLDGKTDLEDSLHTSGVNVPQDLLRDSPQLLCAPIASGPLVVADVAFGRFLKSRNRKMAAVEMESGGVLATVHEHLIPTPILVMRGISDFADDRKGALDQTGNGVFRRVAMRNAVRLFCCAFDAGVFGNHAPVAAAPLSSSTRVEDSVSVRDSFLEECDRELIALRSGSLSELIGALKDHFGFRWEVGSSNQAPPLIYWPVRLRKPTPIHAVQTFAAAALSSLGAQVILCLDDLGNVDHTSADFVSAVTRWWRRAKTGTQFDQRLFSDILASETADGLDPWPFVQKWLGKTNRPLVEVLRISKVAGTEDEDGLKLLLSEKSRPRRLLTPPIVWACMRKVAQDSEKQSVITLGGNDEFPLWAAWRGEIADSQLAVGHLYIPILGETPLHMAQVNLHWSSRDDIRRALEDDVMKSPEKWLEPHRMVPWCLQGCVMLPDFVRNQRSQSSKLTVRADADRPRLVAGLTRALDERLLTHA